MSENRLAEDLYYDALREVYRRSFKTFAAEQLYITGTRPGEILPFDQLLEGQQLLDAIIEKQRQETGWVRVVLIKCRQLGGSTYTAARAFWLAALNEGVSTLEIAHDDDTARSIFEKCKLFYDRMSPEIQPMRRYDNKTELVFENPDHRTRSRFPGLGSRMRFAHSKNITAGTGTTQHFIHLTEASKFRTDMTNLLESSLFPALHLVPGTWCINESTAFVGGDYFRECCERARSGKSEWRFCFVPWYIESKYKLPLDKGEKFKLTAEEKALFKMAKAGQRVDGVPPLEITPEQFKWRRMIVAGRDDGENIFKQEYPSFYEEAWITLDLNVFDRQRMYEMRKDLKDPERFAIVGPGGRMITVHDQHISAEKNYFAIWKEPEKGHRYDIGVDTSIGIEGGDWSVAEIVDRDTHEQVAEFHHLIDGFDLAEQLYWIGIYFNQAQISIEMASSGFAVNGGLQRLGYPYLYIWRHRERSFPTLSTYTGWKTNRESKSYMITMYRQLVNKKQLKLHSQLLWNEMVDFVRMPSVDPSYDQYRAGTGHDDAVMAMGIAIIAGDDESFGMEIRHTSDAKMDRHEAIKEAMAKGGPAFVDDTEADRTPNRLLQTIKRTTTGWDF